MTDKWIRPVEGCVHGVFDRNLVPIETVDQGEKITFTTLDANWGRDAPPGRDNGNAIMPEGAGHALCGPVYIRGAEAGSVLEVQIHSVVPDNWGWTWAGPRPMMKAYDFQVEHETDFLWHIDAGAGFATSKSLPGVRLALRPFMGVMGNTPAASGPHSTTPPRAVGGNMDCAELVAGSTLWLPVEVDGAYFSMGDGHAVQGDGEIGQTALECPMEEVSVSFTVRHDLEIRAPQATTPAGFLTMGFGDTLDEATNAALNSMLDYLCRRLRIQRTQALALASLVVETRVTQIVNTVVGAHALLPHGVLGTTPDVVGY